MKTACLIISFLFLSAVPPKKLAKEISLGKNYKVESTFSGNTLGEDSFHLIIAKNSKTKKFDIIPYHYKGGEISKLKTIPFAKQPKVLSFHNNNGTLSLITKSKEGKSEKIRIIDVNLISGDTKRSDAFSTDDFKAVIREKDKNILLYSNKESIKIINAISAESAEIINIKPEDASKVFFKELANNDVDAINKNEFVKNGSIKDFRAYFESGILTITQENAKEGLTNLVQLPIDKGNKVKVGVKTFKNESLTNKIKKSTSYFSDDKLYQLKLRKDEAKLDIFNLQDDSNKTVDLLSEVFKKHISNKDNVEGFTKNASKGSNAPTVTINKAKDGKLKLRLDYVNKNSYNYRYDWWWHHHWMMHNMMMQQQQMMRASGFGPNVIEDVFFIKDETSHFEIGIDYNGDLINAEGIETIHKDIDKKSMIDELDENKKLKHSSTVFTNDNFRYFAYNKKSKSFIIIDKKLDD